MRVSREAPSFAADGIIRGENAQEHREKNIRREKLGMGIVKGPTHPAIVTRRFDAV